MKPTLPALILISVLLATSSTFAKEQPPNVVLIFADDLGYGDLGCYGATKVQTPNIDRLATEGRRFTDAHSASAVCTPSRYALLTGEYPHRKNLSKPVFLKTGLVIDTRQQTIASLMKDAGYATACIGKWHLGFGERAPNWNGDLKPGPLELGFDYYYGVPVVNSHPPFVYVEDHRVVGLVADDPFVFGKKAKTREFFEKMGRIRSAEPLRLTRCTTTKPWGRRSRAKRSTGSRLVGRIRSSSIWPPPISITRLRLHGDSRGQASAAPTATSFTNSTGSSGRS